MGLSGEADSRGQPIQQMSSSLSRSSSFSSSSPRGMIMLSSTPSEKMAGLGEAFGNEEENLRSDCCQAMLKSTTEEHHHKSCDEFGAPSCVPDAYEKDRLLRIRLCQAGSDDLSQRVRQLEWDSACIRRMAMCPYPLMKQFRRTLGELVRLCPLVTMHLNTPSAHDHMERGESPQPPLGETHNLKGTMIEKAQEWWVENERNNEESFDFDGIAPLHSLGSVAVQLFMNEGNSFNADVDDDLTDDDYSITAVADKNSTFTIDDGDVTERYDTDKQTSDDDSEVGIVPNSAETSSVVNDALPIIIVTDADLPPATYEINSIPFAADDSPPNAPATNELTTVTAPSSSVEREGYCIDNQESSAVFKKNRATQTDTLETSFIPEMDDSPHGYIRHSKDLHLSPYGSRDKILEIIRHLETYLATGEVVVSDGGLYRTPTLSRTSLSRKEIAQAPPTPDATPGSGFNNLNPIDLEAILSILNTPNSC
ncbi:uncharacterized protein LOC143034155 isoform X1 [Oratosquilla oratoria]|uniref:uncharacterized protein LOC143034155 isoform X1 n=1 Tax=Oratosquilla oratoria TaxID=337810 RepID=UPI003F75725C